MNDSRFVYVTSKLSGETFAVSAQPSWIQCDRWILE